MGLITDETVAMIQVNPRHKGLNIETYQSPVALVMSLMNSGTLGGGCYGDEKHTQALDLIEKHLMTVRESIRQDLIAMEKETENPEAED